MKFYNKILYALSLVSMCGMWACTSDVEYEGGETSTKGHPVSVTLTVSRGEAQTRTEISENNVGGLDGIWEDEDVLHVYDTDGNDVGTLTLDGKVSPSVGVFSGTLTVEDGEKDYNIWYYPAENDYLKMGKDSYGNTTVVVNLLKQNFTSEKDFAKVEVLSKVIKLNVKGTSATVTKDEDMRSRMAFARFSLKGIEGKKGTLKMYNANVETSTGSIADYDKTCYQVSFNCTYPDGQPGVASNKENRLEFSNVEGGRDVYAAFVPDRNYTLAFEFTDTEGSVYKYNFKTATTLKAGHYYCSFLQNEGAETGTVSGIEIPMAKDEVLVQVNPADMGSWGGNGENLAPTADPIGPYYHSTTGGWVNNYNSVYSEGGWCYSNENFNGIQDGLVTSKYSSSTDNHNFYQWGRYLGFPKNVGGNKYYYPLQPQIDLVGYLGDNGAGTPVGFECLAMGTSTYTIQKVNDWSLVFGLVDLSKNKALDYSLPNSNVDWYSRSGNPCPDGYRLPTVAELELLVPSNNGFSGSTYAEIKQYNGKKYAFKWTVVRNATIPYIEVKSVETTLSSVNASNSIFNNAKSIKLYANGLLRANNATVLNDKKEGFYWSSESGSNSTTNGGLVGSTSGYGGKGLDIYIDSNAVEIIIGVYPRAYAANILPIYDPSSKGSSIKPIYPYAYLNVENLPRLPQ